MKEKQLTAVEWFAQEVLKSLQMGFISKMKYADLLEQAKEMETEQKAYSKEDVLKAGEMGEINHLDTKHIVSYLDEAKQYNETFKQQEI
jgi:hypothetical protein